MTNRLLISSILSFAALSCTLTGCSGDPSFSIKGNIHEAGGKTLLLEKPDHAGVWMPLDSTRLKADGKFRFECIAPADPEIYRLELDGSYVYFPIDSIENLTLDADAATFSSRYTIEGSDNAKNLALFEKELLAFAPFSSNPDSSRNFKRKVYTKYLQDARGSIVSYYILTKTLDGNPLFSVDSDGAYFAAVATSFRQFRPEDPRTALLEKTATEARHRRNAAAGVQKVVQAEEISLFPINLPNENGLDTPLAQVAGKGKPVILVFSNFNDSATPALNIDLKKIYEAGQADIYNVGCADDQLEWRNSARNLPWATVFADPTEIQKLAATYQFAEFPTMFVIDAAGNLKARCGSMADIKKNL